MAVAVWCGCGCAWSFDRIVIVSCALLRFPGEQEADRKRAEEAEVFPRHCCVRVVRVDVWGGFGSASLSPAIVSGDVIE